MELEVAQQLCARADILFSEYENDLCALKDPEFVSAMIEHTDEMPTTIVGCEKYLQLRIQQIGDLQSQIKAVREQTEHGRSIENLKRLGTKLNELEIHWSRNAHSITIHGYGNMPERRGVAGDFVDYASIVRSAGYDPIETPVTVRVFGFKETGQAYEFYAEPNQLIRVNNSTEFYVTENPKDVDPE